MGNTHSERLYCYCKKGDVVKVGQMLEYQACNINWKNPGNHYRSPLIIASKQGHAEIVKLLIRKGTSIGLRDWFGWNALDYACCKGHYQIVDILTDDPKWLSIGKTIYYNETSLHITCRSKKVEIAELLLRKGGGALVNEKSIRRNTALHYAVGLRGDIRLVELLLEYGASTTIRNIDNRSPLELANFRNFPEAADLIIRYRSSSIIRKVREEVDGADDADQSNDDCTETVNLQCSVRCILSGPPQVGKSTFMKRITGEITNITTAPLTAPLTAPSVSGGRVLAFSSPSQSVTMTLDALTKYRSVLEISSEEEEEMSRSESSDLSEYQSCSPPPHDPEESITSPKRGSNRFTFMEDKFGSINSLDQISSLHIVDTNSQPEFHEILPLILQGPSLHLIFFDISSDLTKEVCIEGEGGYTTQYTPIQILHQLLSSYYDKRSDHSKAILLATHVDKVSGDVERVKRRVDKELRKYFGNADFITKGFIASDLSTRLLFFPIDNMNGEENELKKVVGFFQEVIDKSFPLSEMPYPWALFHYTLQQQYKSNGLCQYKECVKVAKECGIEESNVSKVLQFIHQYIGTILHYEDVEGLKELVICNPDHLFSSIKEVIFDACSNEKIRKTGEIPAELINVSNLQRSDLPIEEWRILNLLKHYNILMTMSPMSNKYFVSSLLLPDTSIATVTQEDINHCPLLIQFDGAFIPVGVFSALVVRLAQEWSLLEENRYSNHAHFLTKDGTTVALLSRMSHLEIQVKQHSHSHLAIYDTIEKALSKVCVFSMKPIYSFGFYCNGSSSPRPHFSQLQRLSSDNMVCIAFTQCLKHRQKVKLSNQHKVWFRSSPSPPPATVERDGKIISQPLRKISMPESQNITEKLREQLKQSERTLKQMDDELHESKVELKVMDEMKDLRISHIEEIIKDQNQEIKLLKEEKEEPEKEEQVPLIDQIPRQLLREICRNVQDYIKKSITNPINKRLSDSKIGIFLSLILLILICLSYKDKTLSITVPMPGVEILASTKLQVAGGRASQLHWEEYGLRLDIPHDALPPGSLAEIIVRVSKSGPYIYPDSKTWKLVSAIYWITSSKDFMKPVLLGLWHNVREIADTSKLRFVTATQHDSSMDHSYTFKEVTGGFFSSRDTYGYISTQHFSGFSVQANRDSSEKFVGNLLQKTSNCKNGNKWDYSFLIYEERPNGMSKQLMNKAGYFGWIMSPPVIVEFESDSILLSINDTSNAAEGWAVTATFPPAKVYKDDITNGVIISNMQFFVMWKGNSIPQSRTLTLNLLGSKRPEAVSFTAGTGGNTIEECDGEIIADNEMLILHLEEVNEVLQFCLCLEVPFHVCERVLRISPDVNEQKIMLVQKWRETVKCRTWKYFIRALALIRKCYKARELAKRYEVQFEKSDKAVERCPTINEYNHEL